METTAPLWQPNISDTDLLATRIAGDLSGAAQGRLVSWQTTSSGSIHGGLLALSLTSNYLPGFTEAFIQGQVQNPVTPAAIAALKLPSDLSSKIQRFLEPAFNGQHHLVLAPFFPPGTDGRMIAANYHYALSSLTRGGLIDPKSTYIAETLQALAVYIESGGGLVVPHSSPVSPLAARGFSKSAKKKHVTFKMFYAS